MKRWLQQWLLILPGVFLANYAVTGIQSSEWTVLLLVAAVLGLLNVFLKPLLILFALPFIIFTLGFGIVLINALLVLLAGELVPGFDVASFGSAFWSGLLISLSSLVASVLCGDRQKFKIEVNRRRGRASGRSAQSDPNVIDV